MTVTKSKSTVLNPQALKNGVNQLDAKHSKSTDGAHTGDAKENTSAKTSRQLVNEPRKQTFQSFGQINSPNTESKILKSRKSTIFISWSNFEKLS